MRWGGLGWRGAEGGGVGRGGGVGKGRGNGGGKGEKWNEEGEIYL